MTIKDYCEKKNINLMQFSKITGISYDHLRKNLAYVDFPNIKLETARKIFKTTEKYFGKGNGLRLTEYISDKSFI